MLLELFLLHGLQLFPTVTMIQNLVVVFIFEYMLSLMKQLFHIFVHGWILYEEWMFAKATKG
jgi:hypothetical protein